MLSEQTVMKLYTVLLVLGLVVVSLSSAIPKPDDHKNRVYDQDVSDVKHFDQDEDDEDAHNREYDHEAFLGKDEAKTFDQLSPEESKERLRKIYDKIDSDKDGSVTEEELTNWIRYVQKQYIRDDAERQWKEHEPKGDSLTWEGYKFKTYGPLDENDEEDKDTGYNYKTMLARDRKRWDKADANKDGKMTKEEFADFLHPEDVPHMRDVVVDETLEDIDKDKDGSISLDEYITDMWPNQGGKEEEPDWVKTEREQFGNFRDKNKDGIMDREEVKEWIMPPDYDHSEAETKHLISESDANGDGKLSKEEVVNKYDLFVGSQATDFGEALTKHEEL